MVHLSLGTRRHKAKWRVRSAPELGGAKGTKSRQSLLSTEDLVGLKEVIIRELRRRKRRG